MHPPLSSKPSALFLLEEIYWDDIYGPEERAEAGQLVHLPLPFQTFDSVRRAPELLAETEILLSGWGLQRCDEKFLDAAPRLQAIFYAGGTVRGIVSEALWQRGIRLSSTNSALAISVAEFTLGQILLGLKGAFRMASRLRQTREFLRQPFPGLYGTTVGLISMGAIARRLVSLLRPFDLKVIAYDPLLPPAEAEALGIELCSLDELFSRADAVSLHTPSLPETQRMIRASHFRLMKRDAVFINTARGAVIDEAGLIEVLQARPDLFAFLDVTEPEPAAPDSPLYTLPNVLVTPHIAGSLGHECRRMGRLAIAECRRYLRNEPLLGEITREKIS